MDSMPYFHFFWTDDIIEHLAEHDVTPEEFEAIVCDPITTGVSRSSGLPFATGYAEDGRKLICIYDLLDELTVEPITAYEIGG
jgi:hypothetical protein